MTNHEAANFGRLVAIHPVYRPITLPEGPAESAFWTAWNRQDGRAGYLNRRKRRWLEHRSP